MPFSNRFIINDTYIYLWTITEPIEVLKSLCKSLQLSYDEIVEIKALSRQSEKLVEKLLLFEIFHKMVNLCHLENGEPFLKGLNLNISISHTSGLVAIAINHYNRIGIDVEIENNRILKVREKFINESEKIFIEATDIITNAIAWTAKEALFKAIPEDGIDFKEHLQIFELKMIRSNYWQYKGTFTKNLLKKEYDLYSNKIDNIILTLAIEKKK